MLPCACSVTGDPCGTVGGGLTQASAAPFSARLMYTHPSPARAPWWSGTARRVGRRAELCRATEQLVLVSVAGVFSSPCHAGYSPCLPNQPGISDGGRVV